MRFSPRPALAAFLAAAALPFAAAAAQPAAPAPAVDETLLPYASTANSARLPDGRVIHLVCMGRGGPVVILTAGGSGWSISWHKVQPAVARKTRVCAWDPAGLGLSSASPLPQTSDNKASDLRAALKAAGVAGPYVLVGHSLGAYDSLLLADRAPSEVAGMVLVDPSIPDQTAIFDRVTPAQSAWMRRQPDPLVPLLERCAAALRAGTVRPGAPDPDGCLRPPQWPQTWPAPLRAALDRRFTEASPQVIAAAMQTFASNLTSTDQDSRIVVNPGRNYGSMPLVVLTASEYLSPPDYPAAARAEIPAFQAEWRRGHDAYAALSTRGVDRVVPDSTHDMPEAKSQAVIDAIDQVVDEARAAGQVAAAR
jgi:pimeloyl-ACP methyl ester carboxylesterase